MCNSSVIVPIVVVSGLAFLPVLFFIKAMTLAFVVELRGGLANRLRTLWSAHAFALRYRRPVVAIWPITGDMACPSNQLFTLDSPVLLINVDQTNRNYKRLLRVMRWLVSGFGIGLNRPIVPGIPWGDPPRFAPRWMPFQWIQTSTEFEISCHLSAPFRPNNALCRTARLRNDEVASRGPKVVGVHIRRRDHSYSIAMSGTSLFVTEMENIIYSDPHVQFLLCTDDPSEASTLTKLFGSRVHWFPPKSLDRSCHEAAIDAMVDFVTLSSCEAIVGSYLSSFSLLASRYGGIDLKMICADSLSSPV